MIGIDVRVNPVQVLKTLQDRGLLAVKAGVSTIRFLPSYLINDEDINFMVEVVERAIGGGMDKKELEKINRD
jgi:Ornithine/acetylornithine aminotransferase